MPHVDPIAREDLPHLEEWCQLIESVMGFVPSSLNTMAHVPGLVEGFQGLATAVIANPIIDGELKNLVSHVASRAAGCRYCQAHTGATAAHQGTDPAKIAAVWEFETSDLFTDAERPRYGSRSTPARSRLPRPTLPPTASTSTNRRSSRSSRCARCSAISTTGTTRWQPRSKTSRPPSQTRRLRRSAGTPRSTAEISPPGWSASRGRAPSAGHGPERADRSTDRRAWSRSCTPALGRPCSRSARSRSRTCRATRRAA